MTFWIHGVRLGPLHLTIVRNDFLASLLERRIGGFFTREGKWACGTLRVGPICLNLDFDAR